MKVFDLYNRYTNKLKLVEKSENKYLLTSEDPFDLQYMRVGYSSDNKTIEFIDPSGGPFIRINDYEINDKLVYKIEFHDGVYYLYIK